MENSCLSIKVCGKQWPGAESILLNSERIEDPEAMNKIQQLAELEGPLFEHNPEWFKGDGFRTLGICGYGVSMPSRWVSIHRGPEPPQEFNDHTYWICGEIVREWTGKQWKITGILKFS